MVLIPKIVLRLLRCSVSYLVSHLSRIASISIWHVISSQGWSTHARRSIRHHLISSRHLASLLVVLLLVLRVWLNWLRRSKIVLRLLLWSWGIFCVALVLGLNLYDCVFIHSHLILQSVDLLLNKQFLLFQLFVVIFWFRLFCFELGSWPTIHNIVYLLLCQCLTRRFWRCVWFVHPCKQLFLQSVLFCENLA